MDNSDFKYYYELGKHYYKDVLRHRKRNSNE